MASDAGLLARDISRLTARYVFVCVSGSNLNLAAGQASASTHANGTETNDSGKMACQLNAGEME